MVELWKDIVYDGVTYEDYQVSNLGRVKSLNYHRSGKDKILRPSKHKDGYLQVGLCKDRKRKRFLVHRLVATSFIENPDNLPEVNHKDEDKTNNVVENLEWCDRKYNMNYGTLIERSAKARLNGKLSKPVLQFSKTGNFIREWESTSECERSGFCQSNVTRCCRGERKSHKGFIWKYKEV